MKFPALLLLAALLLAAGCAQNRNSTPDVAPSRLASMNDPLAGWSVPPGQTEVEDPATADKAVGGEDGTLDRESPQWEGVRDKAGEGATRRDVRKKPVKPLVPAFPARMRQERISALRPVHFGFDRWDLSEEAKAVLDENVRWIRANPDATVRIEGHTDERGTSEYNLALGERRARKVRAYLIGKGISGKMLETVSFGEEMPVDPAANERAWALNRRVEFSRGDRASVSGIARGVPSG